MNITADTPIVFVIGDDASVRESLASVIRSAGWHPRLLSSAEEFLCLPSGQHPCCLLPAGDLPERVSVHTGIPTSTTPLLWSSAFTVLALRELWP